MLGVYGNIAPKQSLGAKIISDQQGAFQTLRADFSYGYKLQLDKDQTLSFGMSAGVFNKNFSKLRVDNYQNLDQSDVTLNQTYYNSTQFIAGVGLLYNYKALNVGVAMPHLIETSQAVNQLFNINAGYAITINKDFTVTPWAMYQNIPVTKNVGALYVKGQFKNIAWLQAGYQTNKSANVAFGVNMGAFGLGYGFTFSNAELNNLSAGAHEVVFTFKIPSRKTSTVQGNSDALNAIADRLTQLLNKPMSAQVKQEVEKIKLDLQAVEVDNNAGNIKGAAEKLKEIENKLKQLENSVK